MNNITAETVLKELRQLPPFERLKIIAIALPEVEIELPKRLVKQVSPKKKSLYGFWKNLNFDVTEEDIDQARMEVWKNFPREGIMVRK